MLIKQLDSFVADNLCLLTADEFLEAKRFIYLYGCIYMYSKIECHDRVRLIDISINRDDRVAKWTDKIC